MFKKTEVLVLKTTKQSIEKKSKKQLQNLEKKILKLYNILEILQFSIEILYKY